MFCKMADIFVKLFKCLMWIVLIALSVQTIVSAEKKCVQTLCDKGYCCDEKKNATADLKDCCCTPTLLGFSISCTNPAPMHWYWIVLIFGVVAVIPCVVGFLIFRRPRRAYAAM
ncbi:uncharacterized protein LOC128224653 isoform X2 [Mya arenaria]|uniref:uncharacterized protein LOC128224653 isoform X2 n=1 Tax=Mya arenaria TaxID=6604 RepID=UPI0022E8BAA3|nr:uncharacterized protein LOC128224653 isoform X2 [Mya arenaria]